MHLSKNKNKKTTTVLDFVLIGNIAPNLPTWKMLRTPVRNQMVREVSSTKGWQACVTWATLATWMLFCSASAVYPHWWSIFSQESTSQPCASKLMYLLSTRTRPSDQFCWFFQKECRFREYFYTHLDKATRKWLLFHSDTPFLLPQAPSQPFSATTSF